MAISVGARGSRRFTLLLACLLPCLPAASQTGEPPTVRVLVLSLFRPTRLLLSARSGAILRMDTTSVAMPRTEEVMLQASAERVAMLSRGHASPAKTLQLPSTTFTVTVPGKLTRTYTGALTVTSAHGVLRAVLVLPTELAVASIVAAEAPPHTAPEALRAQAVASRSFLLANPHRHADADACDTTHCQFLRGPPPAGSPASLATLATQHQVLTWRATPESPATIVPAMYARSCGGHTRAHRTAAGVYPFYAVACSYCLRHPEVWTRPASAPGPTSEAARIAFNRAHGWSAIPSDTHTQVDGTLQGRGTGHGIGMCQLGAQDLAVRGRTYGQILAHYFPNTRLTTLP